MLRLAERQDHIRRILADRLGTAFDWECGDELLSPDELVRACRAVIKSVRHDGDLTVLVMLRSDGDIDVQFVIPNRRPSCVEAHFILPDGEEREAIAAMGDLLAAFLDERLVLGWNRSWFRGGREFIRIEEITPARKRKLRWVVSWRGTHDWSSA